MTGFFIKKAFFDGWDNFIGILLQNLIFMALLSFALLSVFISEYSYLLMYGVLAVILFASCLFMGGTSNAVFNYSNYDKTTWEPFLKGIKRNIRHSLLFFLLMVLFSLVLIVALPFYMSMSGVMGIALTVILFWVILAFVLAMPYYYPLMNLLPGDGPLKTLKKCFIVVADNIGFSFFFLLYNIFCLVLSVFTLGMIPGLVGMMLASQDAIKLLMKKYDWIEENPDANRKKVPWSELLFEEKEKVGPRSIKSMLFPWKY